MGQVKELRVRKGFIRKGIRVEYTIIANVENTEDLYAAKEHLEGVIDGWLTVFKEPKPAQPEAPKSQAVQVGFTKEDAEKLFTDELCELLSFEDKDKYIKITPRQFLGAENFAEIALAKNRISACQKRCKT